MSKLWSIKLPCSLLFTIALKAANADAATSGSPPKTIPAAAVWVEGFAIVGKLHWNGDGILGANGSGCWHKESGNGAMESKDISSVTSSSSMGVRVSKKLAHRCDSSLLHRPKQRSCTEIIKTDQFKEEYKPRAKSFQGKSKYHTLEEWPRDVDKQLQVLSSPSDFQPHSFCFLPQQPLAK